MKRCGNYGSKFTYARNVQRVTEATLAELVLLLNYFFGTQFSRKIEILFGRWYCVTDGLGLHRKHFCHLLNKAVGTAQPVKVPTQRVGRSGVRIPVRKKNIFFFSSPKRTGWLCGPPSLSIQCAPWSFSGGGVINVRTMMFDRSPLPSAKIKNGFIHTPRTPSWCGLTIYWKPTRVNNLLTHSMEQSPSWEANRFSSRQEIPHILWNPKVHYRIHKYPPPVLILSQLDPVHNPASHFPKIHRNIIFTSTSGFPQWSLSLRFTNQNPVHISSIPHFNYIC